MHTTNATTEPVPILDRARRRRILRDSQRLDQYARSKHRDVAQPAPVAEPLERHDPFTPTELHARAVQRHDHQSAIINVLLTTKRPYQASLIRNNRAPHAARPTAPRLHRDRTERRARFRAAYVVGITNTTRGLHASGKPMPLKYLSAGARRRLAEAANDNHREAAIVPMAA